MPDTSLQAAIVEAYACAPADQVIVDTLQLTHPALQYTDIAVNSGGEWHVFLAQAFKDYTFTLEDDTEQLFNKCAFRFQRPSKDRSGVQELTIAIDNTDERMSTFLDRARKDFNEPIVLRYRPYLEADPTQPQMIPPLLLHIRDASITPVEIQCTASFADIVNKKFPNDLYTRQRFLGLGDG
jgi:hypothetical protein